MKTTKLILTAVIAILLSIGNAAYAFDPDANLSLAPNKYDENGWAPVHHLAKLGEHRRLRELILKFGGKPELRTRDGKQETPLHIAAARGQKRTIETLLRDKRVDTEAFDTWGNTPLHHAASGNGGGPVVQMLLDAGADVAARNLSNSTPLHSAAFRGSRSAIETLVKAGAKINARDVNNRTPMHNAARHNRANVIYWISLNGGGKEDKEKGGLTPLQLAVVFGKTNAARELTKIGARTNVLTDTNEHGRNAMHQAAFDGNAAAVKTLIDLGYDKNKPGRDNWRPIHYAARNNHLDVVQLLLDENAYPYYKTTKHNAYAIEFAEAHHGYSSASAELLRQTQYGDYMGDCMDTGHLASSCNMGYPLFRTQHGNQDPWHYYWDGQPPQ